MFYMVLFLQNSIKCKLIYGERSKVASKWGMGGQRGIEWRIYKWAQIYFSGTLNMFTLLIVVMISWNLNACSLFYGNYNSVSFLVLVSLNLVLDIYNILISTMSPAPHCHPPPKKIKKCGNFIWVSIYGTLITLSGPILTLRSIFSKFIIIAK